MINVGRAGIILRQFLLNKITISQSVFYTSVDIVLCGSRQSQVSPGNLRQYCVNLLYIKPSLAILPSDNFDQGRAG